MLPQPKKYRKNIYGYPKKGLSRKEWLAARRELGIGGSDVGTIAGLNNWQSPVELFYSKCNLWGSWDNSDFSMPTYAGTVLEPYIVKHWWQYYDPDNPTKEGFLENINGERKIFRKASEPQSIYVNTRFPFIAANIDRMFKHKNKKAVLEIKTGSSRLWYQYEGMLPQYVLVQVLTYMYVMEVEYAEICALLDNAHLEVFPIHFTSDEEAIMKNMVAMADDFNSKVMEVREYMEDHNEQESIQFASTLEPEMADPKPYEMFLKERYREINKAVVVDGTDAEREVFALYKREQMKIKEFQKGADEMKAKLIRQFIDRGCGKFDFGDMGSATYDKKTGLRVSPKVLLV